MKLPFPSIQLPLLFDARAMLAEIDALAAADPSTPAADGHPGTVELVAPGNGGDATASTPALLRSPYLRQVLACIGGPWSAVRIERMRGDGEESGRVDVDRYWQQRARLYIPVVATPSLRLDSAGVGAELAPGECWMVDGWRPQRIHASGRTSIHLLAATAGSPRLWALASAGRRPDAASPPWRPQFVAPAAAAAVSPAVNLECGGDAAVMSPWELREHVALLLRESRPHTSLAGLRPLLARLGQSWHAVWAERGPQPTAAAYRELLERCRAELRDAGLDQVGLVNGVGLAEALQRMVFEQAVRPPSDPAPAPAPAGIPVRPMHNGGEATAAVARDPRFDRPVFVVSPPRSGSTLLFEALATSPDLFTVGGESHQVIELLPGLGVMERGDRSNRLTADDAAPEVVAALRMRFEAALRDRNGIGPPAAGRIRMLEKTPKNALRIPFLAAAFPEARFVYLRREPAEVLGSMLDGWASGRFQTYARLPGWPGPAWSFLLVPGWERLAGSDIGHVVGEQWRVSTRHILDGLGALPADRRVVVDYHELVAAPDAVLGFLRGWAGLAGGGTSAATLPPSRSTLTPPAAGKWRRHEQRILPVLEANAALIDRMQAF